MAIAGVKKASPAASASCAMPASGARRLRSTSTASAFSGETYRTRQRALFGGAGVNIRRLRHHRKAVSVLPLPVGARMRVDSPSAIAGQPSACGRVGASKAELNHMRVAGEKRASGSIVERTPTSSSYNVRLFILGTGGFMGDAGEGLIDAEGRIAERMEELERERTRQNHGKIVRDPEKVHALESLRLARMELDRQLVATTHERRRAQLNDAIAEVDRRMKETEATMK